MKKFWNWAAGAVLIVLAIGFLLPVFGRKAAPGLQATNLSKAKQLSIAVKDYAAYHDGRYPNGFTDLVPYPVSAERFDALRYLGALGHENQPRLKYDWIYFGAGFDEKHPPPLLIVSPPAFRGGKLQKRVVILGDGRGSIIKEDEYRELLGETNEAMRKRAATLNTPATEPLPPSPDATVPPADQKTLEATDEKANVR